MPNEYNYQELNLLYEISRLTGVTKQHLYKNLSHHGDTGARAEQNFQALRKGIAKLNRHVAGNDDFRTAIMPCLHELAAILAASVKQNNAALSQQIARFMSLLQQQNPIRVPAPAHNLRKRALHAGNAQRRVRGSYEQEGAYKQASWQYLVTKRANGGKGR